MKTIWRKSRLIIVIAVGGVFLLIFWRLKPGRQPLATASSVQELSLRSKTNREAQTKEDLFRATRKDLSEDEQTALKETFENRLKPALHEWCKAYAGHVPFQPEALTVDNLIEEIGRGKFRMYMFVLDGTTFGIADVDGSAHVSYLNTPDAKKLMALPDGMPPNTDLSVTRSEITKMLKVDSGVNFPPAEIRIIPTAFSSAMNGGVHVNVGGDPNNVASWKFTLVFGSDGILKYYCKGY